MLIRFCESMFGMMEICDQIDVENNLMLFYEKKIHTQAQSTWEF